MKMDWFLHTHTQLLNFMEKTNLQYIDHNEILAYDPGKNTDQSPYHKCQQIHFHAHYKGISDTQFCLWHCQNCLRNKIGRICHWYFPGRNHIAQLWHCIPNGRCNRSQYCNLNQSSPNHKYIYNQDRLNTEMRFCFFKISFIIMILGRFYLLKMA